MPIPQVATETLRDAMTRFDRDFRDATEWADWEQNRAHLYAIEHDGQRYPVKQIVSMAAGLPVSEFSGGVGLRVTPISMWSLEASPLSELRRRNPPWIRDELILALDPLPAILRQPAAERQHRN